jgi:hypothetical protein
MGMHTVLESQRVVGAAPADAFRPTTERFTRSVTGAPAVLPGLASRGELRERGFVALHDLWSDEVATAMSAEAARVRADAAPPAGGPFRRVAPSRPGDQPPLIARGPLLDQLHLDLVGLTRRLTGQVLVPTFAAYYFYEGDDEVRLHLDTADCDLTMISEVLGPLGPLHLHPELAGLTPQQLTVREAHPAWNRESGTPVQHPRRGVTAFRGRQLPHHRPGRELPGLGAIAALHYRSRY